MSPMDEYRWFRDVKITYQTINHLTSVSCAPFDLNRVCLIFSLADKTASPSVILLNPSINPGASNTTKGIPLIPQSTGSYLILTQKDFGNIVNQQWFASNTDNVVNVVLTIFDIALVDWPQDKKIILPGDPDASIESRDRYRPVGPRTPTGNQFLDARWDSLFPPSNGNSYPNK